MTTAMKQDSQTSRDDEKECDAVRQFKSSNDKVKLVSEFYTMIVNDSNPVAELESVIDVCPDILMPLVTSHSTWFERYGPPLHFACFFGRSYEVIELFVGVNPDALQVADKYGDLPLHRVHQDCSLSVIKLLVDTYPISVQALNTNGKTPLQSLCVRKCSFEVIEYLVQLYPQALQIKDKVGRTPLHDACSNGCSYEVIELFVGVNPDALQVADRGGNLPLHFVHQGCSLSVIKLLVDTYPISVQALNTNGKTPLQCACVLKCSFEVIEYLVQLYPQALQIKDKQGCTPFHYACYFNNDMSVIRLLYTSFPLAVRWKNNDGVTPLASVYKWDPAEVTQYLAYECWPVACPLLYIEQDWSVAKPQNKYLEDAAIETVAALIDVACHAHVKHILPDTVTAHIAESVMLSDEKSKTMKKLPTELSSGQHKCETVLDKLDCHTKLDHSTLLTILESEKVQCLLRPEGGHDELQELLDSVIRMNRAGRCACLAKDPENKQQGMKVLESTATRLSGLYYHVRENPLICQQRL